MYKRYRGWKRKPRRRPWYFYAALILGGLIGLELLTRLVVSMAGLSLGSSEPSSEQANLVEAYQLGFRSPTGQPYERLLPQGQLQAVRSPLMGYQLVPQQQNPYWSINPQGFRDEEPISPDKAANEMRIFVLGGSMAFGQLSSSNQTTLASHLETLLNNQVKDQQAKPGSYQPATLPYTADEVAKVLQRPARIPERQYRVVNAAVPGYASGNDLAMLSQQVAAYKPDVVILLNSYEDLLLPSSFGGADIPGLDALLVGDQRQSSGTQVGQTLQGWLNHLYLVKSMQQLAQSSSPEATQSIALNLMTPNQSVAQNLAGDEAELKARIERYQRHLAQIVQWTAANRKRLLVGIQPEISTRSAQQMPPSEQAILSKLGDDYSSRVQTGYEQLISAAQATTQASANTQLLDLHQLYADSEQPVFLSPTSLTDEGYALLAARFQQAIVDQLALEPKPYGGE